LGIGDGGWGIGDWGLGPIPNPQSPIPNPQSPRKQFIILNNFNIIEYIFNLYIYLNLCFENQKWKMKNIP